MRLILLIIFAARIQAAINVSTSHPNRLVVDATRLAAVQAKIGTADWNTFKASVDVNKNNVTSLYIDSLTYYSYNDALVCRATGDTSYCTAALAQLEAAYALSDGFDSGGGLTVDVVNDWIIQPFGLYADFAPLLAGIDFPITYINVSGGVLPSPLTFNTTYFLRYHHKDSLSGYRSYWTISATRGGTPIDMSGATSGSIHGRIPWRMASSAAGSNYPRWFFGLWPVLYDWLYSYMTTDQKTKWYEHLRASMQFVSVLDYDGGGRILNNVWVGDHRAGLRYGIAIVGDDPTDTTAVQTVLNKLDADFANELAANSTFLTGGFIEGIEYAPDQQVMLWEGFDAIYTGTGRTDNRFAALSSYYTGMVDYYTHAFFTGSFAYSSKTYKELIQHGEALKGGVWDVRVDGAKRFAPAGLVHQMLMNLQESMKAIGDTTRASYAKRLTDTYTPLSAMKDAESLGVADMVFNDQSITPADWTSTSLAKWFAGTNEVFMKSGWDSAATNVNIFGTLTTGGSGSIDHIRSEAGAFSFYRKGTTLTGNWTSYSYDASNYFNTDLLRYPGAGSWSSSYSGLIAGAVTPYNNLIGYGYNVQASVDRFETSSSATYGDMNLTGVYRHGWGAVPFDWDWASKTQIVSAAHREWMYLPPDILVIHDKITKSQATPASQWNLHAQAHSVSLGSNTATIDTGTQFLKATVLLPASPKLITKRSERVYVQWASREAAPMLVFEAPINLSPGGTTTVTLSGATGEWAVLNGTWNVTAVDGRNIRINSGQVSTAGISSGFGGQALVLEGHGSSAPYNNLPAVWDASASIPGGKYVEVGGVESANENFFVVMEGVDTAGTPQTVTALTATNLDAAQFGIRVVGFVSQALTLPITYTHSASGQHRLAGFVPSTTYKVDTSTPGTVTITASGSGTSVTSSAAGVLTYYPGAAPLSLAGATLTGGTVAIAYSGQILATGGTSPYSYAVTSGTLCGGLTLSTAGLLTGTPTNAQTCSFGVTATDSVAATATATFGITIAGQSPIILTSSLPAGAVSAAYSASLSANLGVQPYTWTLASGTLCSGLSLSSVGIISGVPTTEQTCSFTVRVTDSVAATTTAALSITIGPAGSTDPLGTNEAVSVSVRRRGPSAIVTLRMAGLAWDRSCAVDAMTADFSIVYGTVSVGGLAVRQVAISNLTPATTYHFVVRCGSDGGTAQNVAGVAAVSGPVSFLVRASGSFTVEYGPIFASSVASSSGAATLTGLWAGEANQFRIVRGGITGAVQPFIP